MRRQKPQELSALMRAFLREEGLETPLNEYRATQAWPQVMGEAISRYTTGVDVHGGVMYVQLKSPALKANLMMSRQILVKRINDYVGAQVINNIIFR